MTDYNIAGQTFDLKGRGLTAVTGQESNLGRLIVNHDETHLYLGIEQAMIREHQLIYVFLGHSSNEKLATLPISSDTADQTAPAALRLTEALSFSGFRPSIVGIFGDELADATSSWAPLESKRGLA